MNSEGSEQSRHAGKCKTTNREGEKSHAEIPRLRDKEGRLEEWKSNQ